MPGGGKVKATGALNPLLGVMPMETVVLEFGSRLMVEGPFNAKSPRMVTFTWAC